MNTPKTTTTASAPETRIDAKELAYRKSNPNWQYDDYYNPAYAKEKRERTAAPEAPTEPRIYRVIRFRFNGNPRTIKNNLTEAEAQAHCSREDTSSHSVGAGAWFDGYDYMKGYRP